MMVRVLRLRTGGLLKGNKGNKGKKNGAGRYRGPAGGRTGSTPAAGGKRRQRRSAMAENPADVRGRPMSPDQPMAGDAALAGRSRRRADPCLTGTAVALNQGNFFRIQENLAGCYYLVDDVELRGEQTRHLPLGNQSHPFSGTFYSTRYSLRVEQVRSEGDAVLFGAIHNSMLTPVCDRQSAGDAQRLSCGTDWCNGRRESCQHFPTARQRVSRHW